MGQYKKKFNVSPNGLIGSMTHIPDEAVSRNKIRVGLVPRVEYSPQRFPASLMCAVESIGCRKEAHRICLCHSQAMFMQNNLVMLTCRSGLISATNQGCIYGRPGPKKSDCLWLISMLIKCRQSPCFRSGRP